MVSIVTLTSEHASTTFECVSCTDSRHSGLGPTSRPGGWAKDREPGPLGHGRCKFPKKVVVVKDSTGEFVLVHARHASKSGHVFLQPTEEMRRYFKSAGVKIGFVGMMADLSLRVGLACMLSQSRERVLIPHRTSNPPRKAQIRRKRKISETGKWSTRRTAART